MKNSNELFQKLESIRKEIENVEYWSARDLQEIFGYAKWQNFELLIKKVAISVKNTSESVDNHFTAVSKLIQFAIFFCLFNFKTKMIVNY